MKWFYNFTNRPKDTINSFVSWPTESNTLMLCLKIEIKFMILTQAKASPGPTPVSVLRVVPLTDTLDHLKDCSKITEKTSLYVCHWGNVEHDLDHEVSKTVDNDVVYVRPWLFVVPPTKNIVSNIKHVWLLTQLENPNLWLAAYDLLCPAGRSGCSCHVLAVKWKLDEMSWNNEMKNQRANDVPCTS